MINLSRVMVILNSAAGTKNLAGGETIEARLAELFAGGGVDAQIAVAGDGDELAVLAERAVNEGYAVVVAGGGDGTVNLVASKLVGSRTCLGVLPLGTLNHFAKDLQIPLDVEKATQTIIDGYTAQVDVGEVNGQIFINNSSIGLYPNIVRQRERQQERHGRGKWLALVRAAFTVLRRYPFLSVRLTADGRELTRHTPLVFVGNNEYEMDSFQLGARSCLNKGQLSLYVAHHVSRARLLQRLRCEKCFEAKKAVSWPTAMRRHRRGSRRTSPALPRPCRPAFSPAPSSLHASLRSPQWFAPPCGKSGNIASLSTSS